MPRRQAALRGWRWGCGGGERGRASPSRERGEAMERGAAGAVRGPGEEEAAPEVRGAAGRRHPLGEGMALGGGNFSAGRRHRAPSCRVPSLPGPCAEPGALPEPGPSAAAPARPCCPARHRGGWGGPGAVPGRSRCPARAAPERCSLRLPAWGFGVAMRFRYRNRVCGAVTGMMVVCPCMELHRDARSCSFCLGRAPAGLPVFLKVYAKLSL